MIRKIIMKTQIDTFKAPLYLMIFALFIFDAGIANAQRMGGGGGRGGGGMSRGGGGASMSRPAPSARPSQPSSRPSPSYGGGSASTRQTPSYGGNTPSTRPSINGGSQKSPDRSNRPTTVNSGTNQANRTAAKPTDNSRESGRNKGVANDK